MKKRIMALFAILVLFLVAGMLTGTAVADVNSHDASISYLFQHVLAPGAG